MPVVVTPEARSPIIDALNVESVVPDAAASVAEVEDTGADAVVVDSDDTTLVTAIRDASGGADVPIILISTDEDWMGPADAILHPDAEPSAAVDAIERARSAATYRTAVGDLYEACRGRAAGRPEQSIRDLRATADEAYEDLDELPPSAFHSTMDDEQ